MSKPVNRGGQRPEMSHEQTSGVHLVCRHRVSSRLRSSPHAAVGGGASGVRGGATAAGAARGLKGAARAGRAAAAAQPTSRSRGTAPVRRSPAPPTGAPPRPTGGPAPARRSPAPPALTFPVSANPAVVGPALPVLQEGSAGSSRAGLSALPAPCSRRCGSQAGLQGCPA